MGETKVGENSLNRFVTNRICQNVKKVSVAIAIVHTKLVPVSEGIELAKMQLEDLRMVLLQRPSSHSYVHWFYTGSLMSTSRVMFIHVHVCFKANYTSRVLYWISSFMYMYALKPTIHGITITNSEAFKCQTDTFNELYLVSFMQTLLC